MGVRKKVDGKGGTDTTKYEDKKDGNCVNTAFLSGADASIRGSGWGRGGGGGGAYDEELDLFRPLPPPEVLVSRPSERQINRGKCL